MKKLLCLLLCLVCLPAFALAEVDLQSMSFDELKELQNSIEEELKTRSINKLDFSSLCSEELEQFIVTALLELCSREEYVNTMNSSGIENRFASWFGKSGIHLIFCDTKENWHYIPLSSEQVELKFNTRLEQIIEEAAQIELP